MVGPTALCWRACRCVGVVFCDGDWCVCSVFHILEQEVAAAAEAGSASNKHRRCVQHEPVPWAREPMALLCTGNCLLAQQSERGSLWTVSTTSIRPLNYLGGTIRWPVVRTADPQSRCVLTVSRAGVAAAVVIVIGGNTAKPKECVELVFATTAAPAGVQPTLALRVRAA